MLVRSRDQSSVRRKFVHFTVAITTVLVGIFTFYFHSSYIDAFSLGVRTPPPNQGFHQQQQVSKDPSSSHATIRARRPFRPFARLQRRKASKDDKDNDDANTDGSPSPFFAKTEDAFSPKLKPEPPLRAPPMSLLSRVEKPVDKVEIKDAVSPKLEQQAQDQQPGGNDLKKETSSPFFAKSEDQFQVTDKVSLKQTDVAKKTSSPFFAKQGDQFQAKDKAAPKLEQQTDVAKKTSSPFFAKKEDQFQAKDKAAPKLEPQTDVAKKTSSPFFAKRESKASPNFSPFLAKKEDRDEIVSKESPNLEIQPEERQVEETSGSFSPLFASKEEQLQIMNAQSSDLGQESKQRQVDENELNEDLKKVESSGGDSSSPFFASGEDRFQIVNTETPSTKSKREPPIMTPPKMLLNRVKNEEFKNPVDSFQGLSDEDKQVIMDKTKETLLGAFEIMKTIPSKVEDTVEKTQQVLKVVQDVSQKVNKSVQETKQVVDETVEKTQETVDGAVEKTQQVLKVVQDVSEKVDKSVQEVSQKVDKSVQDTKHVVEENVEKTQEAMKSVEDMTKKVTQSVEDTKRSITETKDSVRDAVSGEVFDLAGNATLATAKLALWFGVGMGSLAGKGVKSAYENTIGPSVEEVWNEKMGSINEKIESINKSVETATELVKNTPSKVKSAVTSNIQQAVTFDSRSESSEKEAKDVDEDPAFLFGGATTKEQPTSVQESQVSVSSSAEAKIEVADVEEVPALAFDEETTKEQPTSVQESQVPVSSSAEAKIDVADVEEVPAFLFDEETSIEQPTSVQESQTSVSSRADAKTTKPAFVSREKLDADSKNSHEAKEEETMEKETAQPVMEIETSPEELNVKLDEVQKMNEKLDKVQKMARDLSDALDAAEIAMKMKPNAELEDSMIDIGEPESMATIETTETPPLPSMTEDKATSVKKNKKKNDVNEVLARFKASVFKTSKTEDDMDAELEESEALAKEIEDALAAAEQALITAGDIEVDEATKNTTTTTRAP